MLRLPFLNHILRGAPPVSWARRLHRLGPLSSDTTSTTMADFVVNKNDLSQCKVLESQRPAIEEGEALLAIRRFSFTANNISYAGTTEPAHDCTTRVCLLINPTF